MRRQCIARSIAVFVLMVSFGYATDIFAGAKEEVVCQVEDKSYEELNAMESLANQARNFYWNGEYQKALQIFNSLSETSHPSTTLYFNEAAQCQLALGNMKEAEKNLRNVEKFFNAFNTEEREESAISNFGEESRKIYLGDPYEKATSYLLLTLIYMGKGDNENALAACKSGILADSDARENKYESDFTLLQLLEMKLLTLLGKADSMANYRKLARTSYLNSHPKVRDLYSDRLDALELLSFSEEKREELNITESPEETKAKLKEIDVKLSVAYQSVDPEKELGALLTGDYNTLVMVPTGKGPHKIRKGKDGQLVVVNTDDMSYGRPVLYIDGEYVSINPVSEVANISYHAATQGGRKMEALLKGKASFRSTTVGVGSLLTDIGNNVGGIAGLALVVAGVTTQGIGGAMTPEADTRAWQLLPATYDVYALNLPDGEHEVSITQSLYFEKSSEWKNTFTISGQRKLSVLLAPPAPVGRYSDLAGTTSRRSNVARLTGKSTGKKGLLITPPLGLKRIVRFPALEEDEKPEAIAPDWKKFSRKVGKKFTCPDIKASSASHLDITENADLLRKAFPLALQTEVRGVDLKKENDDKVYSMNLTFSFVETGSGQVLEKESVTGKYRKGEDDETSSTDAYYKCLDDALSKFQTKTNVGELMQKSSAAASL